jgi:hypothetical protein
MQKYTVIIENPADYWYYFLCEADDALHAEEQANNAYPHHTVVWVNEGENYSLEDVELFYGKIWKHMN